MLHASFGDWSSYDVLRFEVPRSARDGDRIQVSGVTFLDLGPTCVPLDGIAGSLALSATGFEPGTEVPFRLEVSWHRLRDAERWSRVTASGVARVAQ